MGAVITGVSPLQAEISRPKEEEKDWVEDAIAWALGGNLDVHLAKQVHYKREPTCRPHLCIAN